MSQNSPADKPLWAEFPAFRWWLLLQSDLFDLGYEIIGEMNSKMKTIADWQEQPFKKGVLYCVDAGRLQGVLLWNMWGKVDGARALMKDKAPSKEKDLIGRIKGK